MKIDKSDTEYKELRDWDREGDAREKNLFIAAGDVEYKKFMNINSNNIKYALEIAVFFLNLSKSAILYGKYNYADKYVELAYPYSQSAIEKDLRKGEFQILTLNDARYTQYKTRHLLEWYKTGVEPVRDKEKILEHVVQISSEIKAKQFKKAANMAAIRECTHLGDFDLAKEQLAVYYTRKKNQEINADIIYTPRIFYDYILEYLSDEENHKDMYSKLETVFMTFFNETDKNNWTLALAYSTDENLCEIYYIWYKYFMKVDKKELTAKNVYQSLRYGLFFWRKDKTK